jgi:plasmid stabilization system protein ParE
MEQTPIYKVVISERARQMLSEHMRFLAQTSPISARNVKNALIAAIRSLNQFPERFPFISADFIPPNKYHKMLAEKRYLILYQIKDQTVYVDLVVDCRQDYSWLLW